MENDYMKLLSRAILFIKQKRLLPKNAYFRVYTLNWLQQVKIKGNDYKFKRVN